MLSTKFVYRSFIYSLCIIYMYKQDLALNFYNGWYHKTKPNQAKLILQSTPVLGECGGTSSLSLLPRSLGPGALVPVRIPYMDQIDLFENY